MSNDDWSFLDASNFPDRPDHPDFWKLSKIALANDAAATEDRKPIPEIIGEFIDYKSLEYFALHRASHMAREGKMSPSMVPVIASVWLDAFITGARFNKEGA